VADDSTERRTSGCKKSFRTLAAALFLAALEQWPVVKPIWQWLRKEAVGLRRGWVLFITGAVALCILTAYETHKWDTKPVSEPSSVPPGWTETEVQQREFALSAFNRASVYRSQKEYSSAADEFELVFSLYVQLALRHPDYWGMVAHQLGNLMAMCQNAGRNDEALQAVATQRALIHDLEKPKLPDQSSPGVIAALQLNDKLGKRSAK
jgi:hypothetical protein